MVEWSDAHKYNSFNSYKGLTYFEQYRIIADWFAKKKDVGLPAPVEASIDPIATCNLKCYYCNSQRYLRDNPDEMQGKKFLSYKEMKDLIVFFKEWGVKGVCFGGGGESLMNKHTWSMPSLVAANGMQSAIVTNGTVMNDTIAMEMQYCRWVGFSVDAADRETYEKIHGVDMFDTVIENISTLVERQRSKGFGMEIAFKFLILPENNHQIFEAGVLAKNLGVQDFHVRPVDLERKDYKGEPYEFDTGAINKQLQRCHQLDDENYRVFTVRHKYRDNLQVCQNFNRCLASPLVLQCCTDGNSYVCVDHRIEERFRLGAFLPDGKEILKWWGSDEHRYLLDSIKPHEECSRCTWSAYNEQIEKTVLEDRLCCSFP